MLFYYVVRSKSGYAVWEMTQDEMSNRISADPMLASRLDRAPYKTRVEAEKAESRTDGFKPRWRVTGAPIMPVSSRKISLSAKHNLLGPRFF